MQKYINFEIVIYGMIKKILIIIMLIMLLPLLSNAIEYTLDDSTGLVSSGVLFLDGYAYISGASGWTNKYLRNQYPIKIEDVSGNAFYFKATRPYPNSIDRNQITGIMANNRTTPHNSWAGGISYGIMWFSHGTGYRAQILEYSNDLTYSTYLDYAFVWTAQVMDFKIVIDEVRGAKYYYKVSVANDIITDDNWILIEDTSPTGTNLGRFFTDDLYMWYSSFASSTTGRLYYMKYDEAVDVLDFESITANSETFINGTCYSENFIEWETIVNNPLGNNNVTQYYKLYKNNEIIVEETQFASNNLTGNLLLDNLSNGNYSIVFLVLNGLDVYEVNYSFGIEVVLYLEIVSPRTESYFTYDVENLTISVFTSLDANCYYDYNDTRYIFDETSETSHSTFFNMGEATEEEKSFNVEIYCECVISSSINNSALLDFYQNQVPLSLEIYVPIDMQEFDRSINQIEFHIETNYQADCYYLVNNMSEHLSFTRTGNSIHKTNYSAFYPDISEYNTSFICDGIFVPESVESSVTFYLVDTIEGEQTLVGEIAPIVNDGFNFIGVLFNFSTGIFIAMIPLVIMLVFVGFFIVIISILPEVMGGFLKKK